MHREPMAQLLIITNMWPEPSRPAYGVFVQRQVEGLRAAGVRCDVLYVRGYMSKLVYLLGVPLFLALTIAARGRYRLAHVHGGEMALVARFLIATSMVATYHGDDVLGYKGDSGPVSLASRIRSFAIRAHARTFAATVTQSREMHARLPACARRRDAVIHCGVDSSRFAPEDSREARRRLGWEQDERIVLFAATRPHEPRKRLDIAQAAIRRAESSVGAVRLAVAENVAPELIPTMMNAADCLLLTSMAEGSPVVVKEALMCNLPVVATDVADVGELLAGISPSAVRGHDPTELGDALADVLGAGRRSNGRAARPDLDHTTTVRRLLEMYARLGLDVASRREPLRARETEDRTSIKR